MINKLIEYSIKNRWLVLSIGVIILIAGIYAFREIAVDAIPDLSDVQVIIFNSCCSECHLIICNLSKKVAQCIKGRVWSRIKCCR